MSVWRFFVSSGRRHTRCALVTGVQTCALPILARAIARGIVTRGWHEAWPDERRQFACLPFQHSEDIGDQRESLRLFGGFDDPMFQDYAQKHFDIVDR